VHWPSGTVDILGPFFANNTIIIEEGSGVSGLADITESISIELSPNPAHDQAVLNIERFLELSGVQWTIELRDLTGRLIQVQRANQSRMLIDLKYLRAGVYLYTLVADQKVFHGGRLVKE